MRLLGCERLGLTKAAQYKLHQRVYSSLWLCCSSDCNEAAFFVMNLVRLYRLWINPIRGLKPSQIEELILSCKQVTEQFNVTHTSIAHLYSSDTFRLRQHFSFWTLILYKAAWIAHRIQSPFGNFNPVFQIFTWCLSPMKEFHPRKGYFLGALKMSYFYFPVDKLSFLIFSFDLAAPF